ncbi:RHS repeat domain-containing protein [Streptosporangium sp. NPDC000509]|uniref:RHS repeat domain-containing protein n=1 Tax=Streptosporangium sp. NPDC000509 TaxID=3366186 RepID=UPI0036979EFB
MSQSNEYDPAGNLTQQISGGGKTTVDYVYDAAGQLTSATLDPAALRTPNRMRSVVEAAPADDGGGQDHEGFMDVVADLPADA